MSYGDRHLTGIGMTSARTRGRLVGRLREEGIQNEAVLDLINSVPRHLFVDEALASRAYEDNALPIGYGQTISQPYVVARMTEALLGERASLGKVLEIGTGCGYQTAILAALAESVNSIERIAPLLRKARERIRHLNLRNVRFRHADGWGGWPANAPYDAILVAAAPRRLPPELIEQLADGGRMVVPVGAAGDQELLLLERQGSQLEQRSLERVSFVPLLDGTR